MRCVVEGALEPDGPWVVLATFYGQVVFDDVTVREWESRYSHLRYTQEWEDQA